MQIDLARLRHVLSVADTGSFSRAAEEQNLSQPALSRSIAMVESRYGIRLFDRGRGGVVITPAGLQVIEQARGVVAAADDLDHQMRLYGKAEAGRISIGLGATLASLLLPPLSQALLGSRPNLQIQTLVKAPEQLVVDLLHNNIEMIIGSSRMIDDLSDLVAQHLGVLDLVLTVRGDHPLVGKNGLTRSDLVEFPVAKPAGFAASTVGNASGAFICDNFHILRETILGTNCIALFASAFIKDELRDGRLATLDVIDFEPVKNEVCIISKPDRAAGPLNALVRQTAKRILDEMRVV